MEKEKMKKRPKLVCFISLIMLFWNGSQAVRTMFNAGRLLDNSRPPFPYDQPLYSFIFLFGLAVLAAQVAWLYRFYYLKQSAKLWTHIALGSTVLFNIVSFILLGMFTRTGWKAPDAVVLLVGIIMYAIVWILLYRYIAKKKIDDQIVFSK